MDILSGKIVAEAVKERVATKITSLTQEGRRPPNLAVIYVGDDPASAIYVNHKEKACAKVGISSSVLRLGPNTSAATLEEKIRQLNDNSEVDGILLQLPLPGQLDKDVMINLISPAKDVDGLTIFNQGLLNSGRPHLTPCTAKGVITLLQHYNIPLAGKHVVIIGRSLLVGKPLAQCLLQENATVTVAHSKSEDLPSIAARGDVLVAAAGVPRLVDNSWIKPGAVVVDIGIHRDETGLFGDVDFASATEKASAITPVPGGVGPMTIATLLENCLLCYSSTTTKQEDKRPISLSDR